MNKDGGDLINVGSKDNPIWVHKDAEPFSTPVKGGYVQAIYKSDAEYLAEVAHMKTILYVLATALISVTAFSILRQPTALICHWQVPLKTNYVLCSDGKTYPAPNMKNAIVLPHIRDTMGEK